MKSLTKRQLEVMEVALTALESNLDYINIVMDIPVTQEEIDELVILVNTSKCLIK